MDDCPSETTLVAFVEGRLDEEDGRLLQDHASSCRTCRERVSSTFGGGGTVPESVAVPSSRRRLGRYALLRMLGVGGMGAVYEALDEELDRRVALKLLRERWSGEESTEGRLRREAKAMAKLAHPNVVAVYDVGVAEGQPYLTMELIDGVTLAVWAHEEPRPWRTIVYVFLQAGRGLAAAHAVGIVHRDFKPENVLIARSGRVCVTDFGIAAPERDASDGHIAGTPAYMAPEQMSRGLVDARADVFAFSVALYEAVFGTRPFTASTPAGMQEAIKLQQVNVPRRRGPAWLREAIVRGLRATPGDRYATMDALLVAVDPRRRTRARDLAVGVLGLALVASATWVVGRPSVVLHPVVAAAAVASPNGLSAPPLSGRPIKEAPVQVLVLGIDNLTEDRLFDGTVELVLGNAIHRSDTIAVFMLGSLLSLAAELDPDDQQLDVHLAEKLLARDGGTVVTVRGVVAGKGAAYISSIVARDASSGAVLFSGAEEAASPAAVVPSLGRLATALRVALGDPAPTERESAEQTGMSTSLEADHDVIVGSALVDTGKYNEGIAELRRALKLDRRFARAHWALGNVLHNLGHAPEATREFELGLQTSGGMTAGEHAELQGDYFRAVGDYDSAITSFEEVLRKGPDNLRVETTLMDVYEQANYPARALELARGTAKGHPKQVVVWSNLAGAELRASYVDRAVEEAEKAIADFPRPLPHAYVYLALAEALGGQQVKATDAYDKLVPRDASLASYGLADLALAGGRAAEAIALLERGMAADVAAKDSDALGRKRVLLAEARLRRRDLGGALDAERKAVDTSEPAMLYARAMTEIEARDDTTALAIANDLTRSTAEDARVYGKLLKGEVLRAQAKPRDALVRFDEAQHISDSWLGHFAMARAHLDLGEHAKAERELRTCLDRRGEAGLAFGSDAPSARFVPPLTYYLARALEGQSRPEARATYEAFLALVPRAENDPLADDARKRLTKL